MRVNDEVNPRSRSSLAFMLCLGLALLVGFVVSGVSMLHVEYAHASTLDSAQQSPINIWAAEKGMARTTLDPVRDYRPPNYGPAEGHNRLAYFGSGAAIMTLLSVLRLNFINWPLHPVGFLVAYSYPIRMMWLSILLGWIVKLLIVRFGGVELMRRARPAFLGLIIGEAGAAAFWLVVSLVLHSCGMEFRAVNLLPI
jgi:hypothetical protein